MLREKRKVLVACEESQAITKEFRELGIEAYSCDILDCSGGHPEWHIKGDAIEVAYDKSYKWDIMIAHPPCTFLSVSGARWMYHPDDKHLPTTERRPHPQHPTRKIDQMEALEFVQKLMDAPIEKIAIENPISVISSQIRKPDQIVHPWMFGDKATKATCLWLKNLPILESTNIVDKGEFIEYGNGNKMAKWQNDCALESLKEKDPTKRKHIRQRLRSKTFKGMAQAIAKQWGLEFSNEINLFNFKGEVK